MFHGCLVREEKFVLHRWDSNGLTESLWLTLKIFSWDDATIAERYSGEVGEEYKERLTSKVEGKEYVKSDKPPPTSKPAISSSTAGSRSQTPSNANLGRNSPAVGADSRKAKVDAEYFARLGADNASRPDGVAPSQGGKYGGFGSGGWEPSKENNKGEEKLPGLEDLQKDPVAALTKGFGWFASTVGKTAKTVNEGYIQPTAQKVCIGFNGGSYFIANEISS